jgi:hypothetical protein
MRRLTVAVVLLLCGSSSADPESPEPSRRTLNGHRFIQSLMIADPFTSSNVSLQAGSGSTFTAAGAHRTRLALSNQGWTAAMQMSLARWWALRLAGSTHVHSIEWDAIASWEVMPGTTLSWPIAPWLRLGAVLDFGYRIVLAMPQRRVETFTLQPGLALAIAPSRLLGFTFTLQHQWERRDDRITTVDNSRVALAAAVDLNLGPVGVLVAWRGQIPVLGAAESIHDLEVGLHYNGRDSLTLGVVARGRWFDVLPGLAAHSITGTLVVRYYWN